MIRSSQISDSSATGDLESRSSNLGPSVLRPQTSESECPCIHDPVTLGGKKSTLNGFPMEAHIISNIGDQNLGAAAAYYGSKTNFLLSDQCPHTCCRRRETQNQSLEMLLEVILLMSSVHAAGAYAFGKMIRIREHDPNSNRSLRPLLRYLLHPSHAPSLAP
ncbi:hypothetical protein MKW92_024553 [Papaver armeniacum]|nr:hypothetical protein MKW92_024553 [Papaver armeniacum]